MLEEVLAPCVGRFESCLASRCFEYNLVDI